MTTAVIATLLLFVGSALWAQKQNKLPIPKSQFNLARYSCMKADVGSFLTNEFRFWYQQRLFGHNFFTLSPGGFHWYSPQGLQRQTGFTVRAALEKYFFTRNSPQGIFLRLGGSWRSRRMALLDEHLQPATHFWVHSPGGFAGMGRQWVFSPWKEFTFGFCAGVEYFVNLYSADRKALVRKNWYVFPFVDELRLFLSLEFGFAFRQKNRHW